MPRSRPVDYPQVHPPTAQTYQGLAPPSNVFADPDRFSWQNSSTDLVSSSHVAEKELEAGIAGKQEERRQSTVPPLPVLPDHLGGYQQQENSQQVSLQEKTEQLTQQILPSHSPVHTEIAQQYYQRIPQQQAYQFRPDVPKHIQQHYPTQQIDLHRQPLGPPLSYEASQAQITSQQPPTSHSRMQEQPMYPGYLNGSQPMSAHALPLHVPYQAALVEGVESSDWKSGNESQAMHQAQQIPSVQLHKLGQQITAASRQQRPAAVYIGPDIHPLSPTTPTMTSPTHMTRNEASSPTDPNSNQFSTFPQVTSFTPPSPRRGGGTWRTSLFSCSNPSICLPALACPCIIYGRTQYRLSRKSANKDATNMLGYSAINGSCLAWAVLCGVNVLLTAIQHTRIRKKYEMQEGSGNVAGDCVKSLCCCCCIIAMDEREVKMREEGKIGGKDGTIEKAYTSPGAMVYSPPPR